MPISGKLLGALACTVIMAILLTLGGQTVLEWREAAHQNAQRGTTMNTTAGVLADNAAAREDTKRDEANTESARVIYHEKVIEVVRNEPATADWRDLPVPDSMRALARERRLARDRSGRVPVGLEGGRGAKAPSGAD